jgi:DNA invertase Pin-like site-specific DNA recombinase
MKGGVRFENELNGYIAIVHTWENATCDGEPTEWCSPKVFPTEEEAMRYYKSYIRPELQRMMSKIQNESSEGTFIHRELE